ncbi:glutamyl-tRNA reductase [Nanchangia anserum]|uniref:Glutamyl-tRNA reductase n=1 Tax=Nanchangia anserum TaxID=2692125 RepID=A0A8I0G835_9ACTO|nr:glutamyl-tRNA reductase [Nanchangia anserum]MBD3689597.1 glutamyl-tRNA reductase [Nanchangia anserum]QOX81780.1 glutamyl-tRNA reductase [Nanchangia anserum]
MAICSYTVHHATHGLDTVAAAHAHLDGLAGDLIERPGVDGIVVIPTCNRLEVLLDAARDDALDRHVATRIDVETPTRYEGHDAIRHIVRVAAGLDSLVVGEREVSGQVRRALTVAHNHHTATPALTRIIQGALTTSRRIAQLTGLSSQGRSVVAAGLDLVGDTLAGRRALIVGTGAYAGATVAALRARGVLDIRVYSSSGRARDFARGHDLVPVDADDLAEALAHADLTITCRGLGSPALTRADIRRARRERDSDLVILDLALRRDIEAGSENEPGVRVITMADVRAAVPDAESHQVARALTLVDEGVAEIESELRSRAAVPAVRAVREFITAALDDEIARLPATATLSRDDALRSLRRLAARLAHTPTIRAREAAEGGRTDAFVDALHEVMGLVVDYPRSDRAGGATDWDEARCPATGLSVTDLVSEPSPTQEAV